MENDTFARKLEKDFSLPWHLQRVGEASEIITASGNPLFYIKCGKTEQDWNACKYLVHCANLMPECVNMLKEADMYMTSMFVGLCNDCPDKGTEMCRMCKLKTVLDDIETLLAKLEGGAEDERD